MLGEYTPTLAEVRRLTGQGNVVPVYREVRADLETPVSAYLKVARGPYSFLLESVEGGERMGRYSFIGTEPYRVLAREHADGDPLTWALDRIRTRLPQMLERAGAGHIPIDAAAVESILPRVSEAAYRARYEHDDAATLAGALGGGQ